MIKTIFKWLTIVRPSKKQIIIYLLLCASIVLCYLFFPISYANIASSITAQSSKRAILWAIINFLIHILTIITTRLLEGNIHQLKNQAKFRLLKLYGIENKQSKLIQTVIDYYSHFSDSFILLLKLVAVIFSAVAYSIFLSLAIFLTSLICFLLSTLIQKSTHKNLSTQTDWSLVTLPKQNEFISTEIIWTIFNLTTTLIIIDLINTQKITLTAFLVITTFINTRLLKPEFSDGLMLKTRILEQAIEQLNNLSEPKNE